MIHVQQDIQFLQSCGFFRQLHLFGKGRFQFCLGVGKLGVGVLQQGSVVIQFLCQAVHQVVHTGDIAVYVGTQTDGMRQGPFHGKPIIRMNGIILQ